MGLNLLLSCSIICALISYDTCTDGDSMKKWQCMVCGYIYDEQAGLPEEGIAPGTRWEDVPDDWMCPECGVGKEDFEMIELA